MEEADGDSNLLIRLGVLYGFELGPVGLAPAFMVDFVDSDEREEIYVFGLNVEWEF